MSVDTFVAGERRGEAAISRWLTDVTTAGGVFEPLGPLPSDGVTSVQEWKHHPVAGTPTFRSNMHFEVDRSDFPNTRLTDPPTSPLGQGQVRLTVQRGSTR